MSHQDAMIARLEGDVEERNAFVQGLIAGAQDQGRSLTDNERELIGNAEKIVKDATEQLDLLYSARSTTMAARERAANVSRELDKMRREVDGAPVEYRSAGAYALDMYRASLGEKDAKERLDVFLRDAAHQKTSDNLGVIPDPIVGNVINFIDAARPLVSFLGPQNMPAATWHRPKVTQHTSVAKQGTNGAAADEKTELVSQKMTITRLNASAVTYGGYVNVSRQNVDFSSPQVLDMIINDLAAQYAIETEAATADLLATTAADAIDYDPDDQDSIAAAVWAGVAAAYAATRGQGRLGLAVSSDVLGVFGPLFQPYAPQNQQGSGFSAGSFGQGVMGSISGVPVIMSSGLGAGESFLFSTAGVEVYEQRVGALQVTEPSVLGIQVAYAGYFTPLAIELGAVIPLTSSQES